MACEKVRMKRTYKAVIEEHLDNYDQMLFLSGPRQVGKTTLAQELESRKEPYLYLNWDDIEDREKLLDGTEAFLKDLHLGQVKNTKPVLVLDEIHKYPKWKNLVKGLYDKHKHDLMIVVTGSSRLNAYRRGGDSLMGRYFIYRVHPLSIGEIVDVSLRKSALVKPRKIAQKDLDHLFKYGGFPEPFIKHDERFYNRWQDLRHQQLLKDDLREISAVQELSQLEVLAKLLANQAGQVCNYSAVAKKVRVQDTTIRRWISILRELYYCFQIRPWSKNVTRSLLKEPKVYLWDWSKIEDIGARVENFAAVHLHKAVQYWTDTGIGKYELHYLRDKEKRKVDFLITWNEKPWMLIEVKTSGKDAIGKSLYHFKEQLEPEFTFQLAYDMEHVDFDIRQLKEPKIVPMRTFFSQLP